MKTSEFAYDLPPNQIAQTAVEPRDHSRLMVVSRRGSSLEHRYFYEIGDYLKAGDVVVCNDSRVIPARLLGHKLDGGARIELLLLRRLEIGIWEALARPARRLKTGTRVELGTNPKIEAQVMDKTGAGTVIVSLPSEEALEKAGFVPLPPYIHHHLDNPERYQTVYAREKG